MSNEEIFDIVEAARETGKISKGINEVTKAIEKGVAKMVVTAEDIDPPEIIMHLKPLCEEKNIDLVKVSTKTELGRAAGLNVPTTAIAIIDAGEAKNKIESITK